MPTHFDLDSIKRDCPKCNASREVIELWNCGPIIYIRCPLCNFRLYESDNAVGVAALLNSWNSLR